MQRVGCLRVLCLLVGMLGAIAPSSAGLLSALVKSSDNLVSSAAKKADNFIPSLDDASRLARQVPGVTDVNRVALVPTKDKGWQLVTAGGSALALDSLDDIGRQLDGLLPRIAQRSVGIAIDEASFFKLRTNLAALPKGVDLHLVYNKSRSYPLHIADHSDGSKRLMVAVAPSMLLNPTNARALEANLELARRSINASDLKLARLETPPPRTSRLTTADTSMVLLDPNALDISLARFKNKTLLLSGDLTTDSSSMSQVLRVADGKTVRSVSLQTLEESAARQRVNLMVVGAASTRQAGQSRLFQTDIEKKLSTAKVALTHQGLIRALAPTDAVSVIHVAEKGQGRLVVSSAFQASGQQAIGAATESGTALATDWLVSSSVRSGLTGIRYNVEDPDHTDDLNSRWFSWISNVDLIFSAVGIIVFGLISLVSWSWWVAIWRLFGMRDHAGRIALAVRFLTFLPFSIIALLPAIGWLAVRDIVKIVLWPFRKLYQWLKRKM